MAFSNRIRFVFHQSRIVKPIFNRNLIGTLSGTRQLQRQSIQICRTFSSVKPPPPPPSPTTSKSPSIPEETSAPPLPDSPPPPELTSEEKIALRESQRMLPKWARRILFWSFLGFFGVFAGVGLYQYIEKKRHPVRLGYRIARTDEEILKALGLDPADEGIDEEGNKTIRLPKWYKTGMFPYGYEFETPGLNMMGVSYSVIPVVASTGAAGIITTQAVRFGCTRDWRVDYVQFELTREPEFHLSVAERERAASFRMDEESGAVTPVPLPSVTTANRFNFSDGVEREPIVVFDRRQPTELLTPLQQRTKADDMNIMEYHFKQLHFEAGDDKVEPKMPEIKEIDESNLLCTFENLWKYTLNQRVDRWSLWKRKSTKANHPEISYDDTFGS